MNSSWTPLFDRLQVGVLLTDSHFQILHANAFVFEIFESEITGLNFSAFFFNVDWFGHDFFQQESPKSSIVTQVRINKSELLTVRLCSEVVEEHHHLIWTVTPLPALDTVGDLPSLNYEIELKNHLRFSYQRLSEFRKALDQTTNIILTDLKGVILDANQSTLDLSGYSKDELIGSHTRVNKSGYHPKNFYKKMWDTIKSGKEWKGEIKNRRKDGSNYWVFTTIFPLKDKFGMIYRFLAVRTDITEQKEAQEKIFQSFEKIKASEKRYSDLFHFSPLPMWIFDVDTRRVLDVNEATLINYGYTREEFVGISIFDLRPADQVGLINDFLAQKTKNFNLYKENFIHKKKSGEQMIVEISSLPIEFEGKLAQFVLANNVTSSIRNLEKVESQNKILRDIAWTQSHLVRAPLARLMGIVQLIRDGIVKQDELNDYLELLDSSALELDQVIMDISLKANMLKY